VVVLGGPTRQRNEGGDLLTGASWRTKGERVLTGNSLGKCRGKDVTKKGSQTKEGKEAKPKGEKVLARFPN